MLKSLRFAYLGGNSDSRFANYDDLVFITIAYVLTKIYRERSENVTREPNRESP